MYWFFLPCRSLHCAGTRCVSVHCSLLLLGGFLRTGLAPARGTFSFLPLFSPFLTFLSSLSFFCWRCVSQPRHFFLFLCVGWECHSFCPQKFQNGVVGQKPKRKRWKHPDSSTCGKRTYHSSNPPLNPASTSAEYCDVNPAMML